MTGWGVRASELEASGAGLLLADAEKKTWLGRGVESWKARVEGEAGGASLRNDAEPHFHPVLAQVLVDIDIVGGVRAGIPRQDHVPVVVPGDRGDGKGPAGQVGRRGSSRQLGDFGRGQDPFPEGDLIHHPSGPAAGRASEDGSDGRGVDVRRKDVLEGPVVPVEHAVDVELDLLVGVVVSVGQVSPSAIEGLAEGVLVIGSALVTKVNVEAVIRALILGPEIQERVGVEG